MYPSFFLSIPSHVRSTLPVTVSSRSYEKRQRDREREAKQKRMQADRVNKASKGARECIAKTYDGGGAKGKGKKVVANKGKEKGGEK